MIIKIRYQSIDRYSQSRTFKTLKGARKFAHAWIGEHPDIGNHYALSGDGVGKITADGVALQKIFPDITPSTYVDDEAGISVQDWMRYMLG